jgi:hypothetical protein
MKNLNQNATYAVLKTVFLTGETTYNVNAIRKNVPHEKAFLRSATDRISIDIRDGKKLNRIQQLIIDNQVESCEVVQLFDNKEHAKTLVNLQMELDKKCIRTKKFPIN